METVFTAQGQLVGQVKKERENIRTLVSDISHQTKTPLANILLYAELLDEKAENEEEKMLAGQIVRQTEKLQFLLQSLVKMSRLETGILELSPADGEIAPMIRETAASLQKKQRQKTSAWTANWKSGSDAGLTESGPQRHWEILSTMR